MIRFSFLFIESLDERVAQSLRGYPRIRICKQMLVGSQGVDFILKSTVSPMAKLSLANQRFDKLTSAHSMADDGHDKDNRDRLSRYRIGRHGCHASVISAKM